MLGLSHGFLSAYVYDYCSLFYVLSLYDMITILFGEFCVNWGIAQLNHSSLINFSLLDVVGVMLLIR